MKQSARIIWKGVDHKDVAFLPNKDAEFQKSHCAMYKGDELVWYKYLDGCWLINRGERILTYHPDTKKLVDNVAGGNNMIACDKNVLTYTSNYFGITYYITKKGGTIFKKADIPTVHGVTWDKLDDAFIRIIGNIGQSNEFWHIKADDEVITYGKTGDTQLYTTAGRFFNASSYHNDRLFLCNPNYPTQKFRFMNKDGSLTDIVELTEFDEVEIVPGNVSVLVEGSAAYVFYPYTDRDDDIGGTNLLYKPKMFRATGTSFNEVGHLDMFSGGASCMLKRDKYYLYFMGTDSPDNLPRFHIFTSNVMSSFSEITPTNGYTTIQGDNVDVCLVFDRSKAPSVSSGTIIIYMDSASIMLEIMNAEKEFTYWEDGEIKDKQGIMLRFGNTLVYMDSPSMSESSNNWAHTF